MTFEDFAFKVAIPTVVLTEKSKHKWVRVLGVLAVFPLLPLAVLGMLLLFISVMVDIYKEI